MIATANRLNGIGEYYFSQKLREIEKLNAEGRDIINLGIGSPDMPPHAKVVETLRSEAAKPNVHAYQGYKGIPALRQAFASWYGQAYGVHLHPDRELLPLMGSKEGIMHVCMTYLNPGDTALVPNPGYPTYRSAVTLAGGACVDYDLTEQSNWLPDFAQLETLAVTHKPRLMWVNYPHMPTGRLPETGLFEALVAFGKKHGILICHDNPYSFILNEQPRSILATPGALDTAVELNSLSKSQNMAGWRVGVLAGHAQRIEEVLRFKSNMDSGMFQPLQMAAVVALQLNSEWYNQLNAAYSARKELMATIPHMLGCSVDTRQAGMFLWCRMPPGYDSAYAFSDEILYGAGVFLTPGGIFGSNGNLYIRLSLCSPAEKIQASIKRIEQYLQSK